MLMDDSSFLLQIEAVKEPEKHFRLETQLLPPAKWGPACGWTTRDDAAMLLGVYWHGMGHWDKIANDDRLLLLAKMAAASAERTDGKKGLDAVPGHRDLPKGAELFQCLSEKTDLGEISRQGQRDADSLVAC